MTSLLIAGLLPAIAALVATYLSSNNILKTAIGTNYQEIAAAVAKKVEMIIDHDINDAQSLALSPDVFQLLKRPPGATPDREEILDNEVSRHFRRWQAQRRQEVLYREIILTDRSGRLVAANVKPERDVYNRETWWQSAYHSGQGAISVSNLYPDKGNGNYYYDVVTPVKPEGGPVLGVLRVSIRRDKLLRAIMEVRIGKTGHAMLVSSDGTPLICPILLPQEHLINAPLMKQIAQPQHGWAIAVDDAHGGRNSIVGFAPVMFRHAVDASSLDRLAWYTFVRQHPDETYAPIYGLLVKVGLVGSALILAISFMGFFAGSIIVRPIQLLKERAQAIGQAVLTLPKQDLNADQELQLSQKIEIQTQDELEDLAQAFNRMSVALEESIWTIKRQQAELIQKEKLASMAQLMAALTHDLKNPLGVIRSSAQLLLSSREKSDKVKGEMCRYIIEEVDRLTYRINDILRYARPRPPRKQPVQVEELLDWAIRQTQGQGRVPQNITFSKKVHPDTPGIEVDPEQIRDTLLNLMINATEAMPRGGSLSVHAEPLEGGRVVIRISDTGEGIRSENLEMVFEPFFSTKIYGVGLGLTNVRRLVKENGGDVGVSTQPGKGTTFTLTFPGSMKKAA